MSYDLGLLLWKWLANLFFLFWLVDFSIFFWGWHFTHTNWKLAMPFSFLLLATINSKKSFRWLNFSTYSSISDIFGFINVAYSKSKVLLMQCLVAQDATLPQVASTNSENLKKTLPPRVIKFNNWFQPPNLKKTLPPKSVIGPIKK